MEQQLTSRLRTGLLISAIGATLAMLPLFLAFWLGWDKGFMRSYGTTLTVSAVLQLIGCVAWFVGLIFTSKPLSELDPVAGGKGAKTLMVAIVIMFVAQTSILVTDFYANINAFRAAGMFKSIGNAPVEGTATVAAVLALVSFIMCAGSSAKLANALVGFKMARVGYLLQIFFIPLFTTLAIMMSTGGILTLAFPPILLAVLGWWLAVLQVKKTVTQRLQHNLEVETRSEEKRIEKAYNEAVRKATIDAKRDALEAVNNGAKLDVGVQMHTQGQPGTLTNADIARLNSLPNDRLNEIVANPGLYANSAYVDEARSILAKRHAWNAIKNLPDQSLLDIVHSSDGSYSYETCDAASMELYRRGSVAFINEVKSFDNATLNAVMAAPKQYYIGYVNAARDILMGKI